MKILEEKIIKEGIILPNDVLKIDCFLNHQIDVKLMEEIGKAFYNLFKNEKVDKVLTIEASGIAMAMPTAKEFGYVKVVFAKKTYALNMADNVYHCHEHSYTRNIDYDVTVAKEYLSENENVLIIDDFLANGEALNALITICQKAKCHIVGCGVVVSKCYQKGEKRISDLGIHLESLARIEKMNPNCPLIFRHTTIS